MILPEALRVQQCDALVPEHALVGQPPAVLVLAQQVPEGVRVEAGGLGANPEHDRGAKDALRDVQLPVVASVVQRSLALDASGTLAPVGMEVHGAGIGPTEHHLLGAMPLAPGPVVLDAV